MARFSVLIPTYRPNSDHLSQTLKGLLEQTEQDWECHICDEPTDVDTEALVEPFLEDQRITFHKNETCLGIGGNWNRCMEYATGELVAFLFQDDVWNPNYLEAAAEIFTDHPSVGFASFYHSYQYDQDLWTKEGYELVHQVQAELEQGLHKKEVILSRWLQRNMHPNIIGEPPFVVMRKSLTDAVGTFDEGMPQFLDVEYWLRCLRHADWYFAKDTFGAFRVHESGASARNNTSGEGLYDRITCFERLIESLSGDLRTQAVAARNRSIEDMMRKFFRRVANKKGVSKKGSGQVWKFVLLHPFVVLKSITKVLTEKSQ